MLNHNLEKIVNNLFNLYFIKFEPFKKNEYINSKLGNIPKGWKISELGEYCKLKSGFAFKSAWWQESGIKIIKIKNIKQGKIDLSDCSFVSLDKISNASEFLVKEGDLIIAMTGATLGKFSIVPKYDEPLYVNQRVGKFFLGERPLLKLPFLWGLLNQKRIFDEIIKRGQGSAQPNISPKDIESIPIIYPPKNIIDKFNDKCIPLFNLMITNSYEIEKLTRIRDTLLPKLMSGEIDVSTIKI